MRVACVSGHWHRNCLPGHQALLCHRFLPMHACIMLMQLVCMHACIRAVTAGCSAAAPGKGPQEGSSVCLKRCAVQLHCSTRRWRWRAPRPATWTRRRRWRACATTITRRATVCPRAGWLGNPSSWAFTVPAELATPVRPIRVLAPFLCSYMHAGQRQDANVCRHAGLCPRNGLAS